MAGYEKEPETGAEPSLPGSGSPIPPPMRHQLEVTLKANLSSVRLHSGHNASALGARAYTNGNNIQFPPGFNAYDDPNLVAHEAAHVVQQRQVGIVPAPRHTF